MWPVRRPFQDDILLASAYDKARVRLKGFGPCLYLVSRDFLRAVMGEGFPATVLVEAR